MRSRPALRALSIADDKAAAWPSDSPAPSSRQTRSESSTVVMPEVALVIEKYTPTFAPQKQVVTEIINEVFVKTLWQSEDTKANGFGYGNIADWQKTIDTAVQYKAIPEKIEAADFVVEKPAGL